MAVSYADRQALSVLAPTITGELELSETEFGWIGSAFSVAYLVATPLAGRFVERVGARRGLLASVLVWSAVSALHGLAPGFAALVILRILLGAAEAPTFPGAATTVARALPPERRSAGYGLLFTGSSIGAAVTATLLPWLAGRYGWRLAIVTSALLGLAWVPMWWAVTSPAAVRAAMAPASPEAATPFRWREVVGHPAVLRGLAAVLATAPIMGVVLQWGAKVLVARHALTQAEVGHYLWLPPLLFDAGAVGFGALATLTGRAAPEAPRRGLFALALALVLLIGALGSGATAWQTTFFAGFALAGAAGAYTLCTADTLGRVPSDRVAVAGSLMASAQSLSLIVAFPLIGAVLDRTHSYAVVGLGLAAWAIPGCLVWLLWDPRPPAAAARLDEPRGQR